MIKYKVFFVGHKKLESVTWDIRMSLLKQVYRKNWNRAKVGGFFVFDTLKNAESWLERLDCSRSQSEIWECEVRNCVDICSDHSNPMTFNQLAKISRRDRWIFLHFQLPFGAEAYRSVKPIRRVL